MTENDVLNSLHICSSTDTCEGCSYRDDGAPCKQCLMKAAYNVIKLQKDHIASARDEINTLSKANEKLQEMAVINYTQEQLVKAVNEILEETTAEDISATAQSVIAFLRLIGADGHFALLPDGTAEIRLDK